MAASASMPLAERTRLHLSQAFQNRAANVANAQGALFEQLLSLSFTVQPPPATEPESDLADSSVVADSTSTTDSKHVATTDEEQDDVANPPVALLTPAIPLIAEQPVEPIRDQSAVDKHANTEALKAVEVAAIGDAEPDRKSVV